MHIIWRDSSEESTYEAARLHQVFNTRTPHRFPKAIIRVANAQDVVAAVKLAIGRDCSIAVRSGGHSFPVWSIQDDSILIDLTDLKEIAVDAVTRTARVSPGIRSEELNEVLTGQYGLMFPAGHCPTVGLGGFLLQGGMGWNCSNWGWACELVDAVEVVTAQGDLLLCNAQQNPDLFWAARGAGPAFPGIITTFHLRLLPNPQSGFRTSGYTYPSHLYKQVFTWVLSIAQTNPADTEVTFISHYRDNNKTPTLLAQFICMKDDPDAATAVLDPIHNSRPTGTLTEWYSRPESLMHLYQAQKNGYPQGPRYLVESAYIRNDVDVVAALEEAFLTLPHPRSTAFWTAMNPRSRRERDDLALSVPSDHYFSGYTAWDEEEDDERCMRHVRRVMAGIDRFAVGAYVGESELSIRRPPYWAREKARRVVEVGREWDPKGRFCRYVPAVDMQDVDIGGDARYEIQLRIVEF